MLTPADPYRLGLTLVLETHQGGSGLAPPIVPLGRSVGSNFGSDLEPPYGIEP